LRAVATLVEFGMRHALRKNERAVVASAQDFPAVPESSPKQQVRTTEQKSREREEQSLYIAQAGAQEVATPPKHTSANPLSPSQNAQKAPPDF